MAPVFLYIARNRYLYNTRIFKRGGVHKYTTNL